MGAGGLRVKVGPLRLLAVSSWSLECGTHSGGIPGSAAVRFHYHMLMHASFAGCSQVSRPFILGPTSLRLWFGSWWLARACTLCVLCRATRVTCLLSSRSRHSRVCMRAAHSHALGETGARAWVGAPRGPTCSAMSLGLGAQPGPDSMPPSFRASFLKRWE